MRGDNCGAKWDGRAVEVAKKAWVLERGETKPPETRGKDDEKGGDNNMEGERAL